MSEETKEVRKPQVRQVTLEMDGELYTLQHPGNRAYIRKYQTLLASEPKDIDAFLDWAFEEIVHPQKGDKLSLDTIPPNKWEDWFGVLVPFLSRGELDPDFKWSGYEGSEFAIAKPEEMQKRLKKLRGKR